MSQVRQKATHNHEHHMPKAKVKAKAQKHIEGINLDAAPSGPGCKDCLEMGGWWMHLNRCAECGHVGCCDNSPNRHSTRHFHENPTHPIIQRYEPDDHFFYDYRTNQERPDLEKTVKLKAPISHPADQPVPGGNLPSQMF